MSSYVVRPSAGEYALGDSVTWLMVKQPGATCPGSPGGATAGLGQVRHRLGSGVDLDAGGIGYGASVERLRDRSLFFFNMK